MKRVLQVQPTLEYFLIAALDACARTAGITGTKTQRLRALVTVIEAYLASDSAPDLGSPGQASCRVKNSSMDC
jgi:hypothetical protein